MALIRYPGSKAKLVSQIYPLFPVGVRRGLFEAASHYVEPFFGSGAMGFSVLRQLPKRSRVILADKDFWIVCLWKSVKDRPKELCRLISDFVPTAEKFYEFKEQDGTMNIDPVLAGFRKLACHQMSISGFGVKSGGPLGGRDQRNAQYPVHCRWNPSALKHQALELSRILNRVEAKVTCRDFAEILRDVSPTAFVYMDPPYVAAGPQLYKHSFCELDHKRLAAAVGSLKCQWALSYDDAPIVRELYKQFEFRELHVTYTNATGACGTRPKNREVLITNYL